MGMFDDVVNKVSSFQSGKWWCGNRYYVCIDGEHFRIDYKTSDQVIDDIINLGECNHAECQDRKIFIPEIVQDLFLERIKKQKEKPTT